MKFYGEGVSQDYVGAFIYLKKSIDAYKMPQAYLLYGKCLIKGLGCDIDFVSGYNYIKEALDNGATDNENLIDNFIIDENGTINFRN